MDIARMGEEQREAYSDGLLMAARLVQRTQTRDPALIRSAASDLAAHATTIFELGVVNGLRLIAEDVQGP
jgi:hypothetical protein